MVEENNPTGLISLLKVNSDVSLIDLIDERGYTLLHEACFLNFEEVAKVLIKYARGTLTNQSLANWINIKTTTDGFTSLHFCSFKGNTNLCELLLKYGANI